MQKTTIDIKAFFRDLNEAWVPGDPNKEWHFRTEAELNDWMNFVTINKRINGYLKDLEGMFCKLQDLKGPEISVMLKIRDEMRSIWINVRSLATKIEKLDSKNYKMIKFFEAWFGDDFITKTRTTTR